MTKFTKKASLIVAVSLALCGCATDANEVSRPNEGNAVVPSFSVGVFR